MSLLNGNLTVSDGYKATYAASINQNVNVILAINDLFVITGSATKTVRVLRIGLSGTSSSTRTAEVLLIKRSTASTGGTIINSGSYNSSNPSATAVIKVNPSGLGSLVGILRSTKLLVPIAGAAFAPQNQYIWNFNRPSQAIVLRGTAESAALNFNGAAVAGTTFEMWIEWTEE